MSGIFWIGLGLAWGLVHVLIWWRLARRPEADEVHLVASGDWDIALHRYRPTEASAWPPVLLVHGILMSRLCFDLVEGGSMARWLRARGFDVWVIELRGSGDGRPRTPAGRRWQYNFDDHVDEDIPAALAFIEAQTGKPRVSWVGHSMGGLIGWAYLARHGEGRITRLVTLGSPMRLSTFPVPPGAELVLRPNTVRLDLLSRSFALLAAALPHQLSPAMGPSGGRWEAVVLWSRGVQKMSSGVFRQLLKWQRRNQLFVRADGTPYPDPFSVLTRPLMCVVGSHDELCSPADGIPSLEQATRSSERTFMCLGPSRVAPSDPEVRVLRGDAAFGHMELIAGRASEEYVYPHLAEFLSGGQSSAPGAEARPTIAAPTAP